MNTLIKNLLLLIYYESIILIYCHPKVGYLIIDDKLIIVENAQTIGA